MFSQFHEHLKYLLLTNRSHCLFQAGRKDRSDALNTAIDRMTKKTRDLRRQVFIFFILIALSCGSLNHYFKKQKANDISSLPTTCHPLVSLATWSTVALALGNKCWQHNTEVTRQYILPWQRRHSVNKWSNNHSSLENIQPTAIRSHLLIVIYGRVQRLRCFTCLCLWIYFWIYGDGDILF